jgi:hypothetical protein
MSRHEYPSLRQGLVFAACPSLGASGLSLIDRSGRNNHGTLTNMAGQDNWRASGSGVALNLDGTNDFVSVPTLGPNGDRSVSVWFNSSMSLSSNQFRWLIGYGNASTGALFLVGFGTSATFGTNGIGVTQFGDSVGTAGVLDGVWRHAAVVNAGTRYEVYVDGVLRATKTMTTNAASTAVTIGRNSTSLADYYTGLTDDIRLYNRALTLAEIRLLASRRGIGLTPLPDRAAGLPKKLFVNDAGTWRNGDAYVNTGSGWRLGVPFVNDAGVWK